MTYRIDFTVSFEMVWAYCYKLNAELQMCVQKPNRNRTEILDCLNEGLKNSSPSWGEIREVKSMQA